MKKNRTWDRGRVARCLPPKSRIQNPKCLSAPSSRAPLPRIFLILIFALPSFTSLATTETRKTPATPTPGSSITISTQPGASIWLDEIRRGVTDASGRLTLSGLSAGRHTLRVRANGFKEATVALFPGRRGNVVVLLVRTTDKAELSFQQAEATREEARDDSGRQKAAELYRRAVKLRPAYAAAHVGLARILLDLNDYESALAEIDEARAARPFYPEASAVEGRIYREQAFEDQAVGSFRRAIREARGFQPEAHVGLARALEDKGQYEEAAAEFEKAISQLSDTEPVIYQMLGAAYEKLQQFKEAIAAYEKYLALAPQASLAPAIRSIIDQLRRQAAGQELTPN